MWFAWIVPALILLSGIFDIFDGEVARRTNRVTKSGAFLDSNLDRLSDIIIIFGLSFSGMINFMQMTGAVRFGAYGGFGLKNDITINFYKPLTPQQIEMLTLPSERANNIYMEVGDKRGNVKWSKQLKSSRGFKQILEEANSYTTAKFR